MTARMRRLGTPRATALILFLALGGQVGVWAAGLPTLAADHGLGPGALGARLATLAMASVAAVLIAGRVADARGRRVIAGCGLLLMAVSFSIFATGELAGAAAFAYFAGYGAASGLLDIAANAVGSDLEAATGKKLMVGLHAGFSGGAALGAACAALFGAAGYTYKQLFLATSVLLLIVGAYVFVAVYPRLRRGTPEQTGAGQGVVRKFARLAPGAVLVIVLGTVCFFGDGVMQSFAPLYLQQTVGTGAVGTALGVALFHLASLSGRVVAVPMLLRGGNEVSVLIVCGTAASASVLLVAVGSSPWIALLGMALAGFMLSPVIPIAYSLLGRAAGSRAGAAISVLAACSYGAFTAAPAAAGAIAEATNLRATLALVVCCYLGCAVIAVCSRNRIGQRAPEEVRS